MPRAVDVDGNTLLHAACARGALRAAKLVARWAVYSAHPPDRNFLNLQSGDGMTALDLARQGGFRKTEEWLVALGALTREIAGREESAAARWLAADGLLDAHAARNLAAYVDDELDGLLEIDGRSRASVHLTMVGPGD